LYWFHFIAPFGWITNKGAKITRPNRKPDGNQPSSDCHFPTSSGGQLVSFMPNEIFSSQGKTAETELIRHNPGLGILRPMPISA
jgi:hypothetical protein